MATIDERKFERKRVTSDGIPTSLISSGVCLAVAGRERRTSVVAGGADASCTHRVRDTHITV